MVLRILREKGDCLKRTVYNASFEESQNLVTEQYLQKCIDNSTRKIVRKRTIGIIVMLLFSISIEASMPALEKYSIETPVGEIKILSNALGAFWYYAAALIFIMYLYLRMKNRKHKLLASYTYIQSNLLALSELVIICSLFVFSLANVVIRGVWPSVFYGILFSYIIYDQTKKYYQRTFEKIYQRKTEEKAWSFYARFLIFASKYGWIIVVLTALLKSFNASHQKEEGATFLQIIFGLAGPLIFIPAYIFMFYIAEELMQGYYLRKYYEQYRLKYNGTTKQWYGEKSKQYKQAKANGKEA